jgi:type IV pilus assembly protein PilN
MAKINLLPWREELRNQRKQEFMAMLGFAAVVAVGVWGLVHVYHTQLIEYHQARNQYLTEEIAKLDKKIEEIKKLQQEKERLLARMRAIEQLQGNRPLVVRLFDELVANLPEGVSLLSVNQKGTAITINGVAQSNARVSTFMRNLEASDWLRNPQLDIIQAKDEEGQRISNFTLRFTQVVPTVSAEQGDDV